MPITLDPISGSSWIYSNEAAFDLFNGIPATDVETDLDDDAIRNSEVLVAAGVRGDDYINSKLNGIGWPVPLTGMDARTTRRVQDMSNHGARWQLAESKNWGLYVGQNISVQDQAKIGLTDKKYVDDWLKALASGDETIVADGAPEPGGEGGFESIPVIDLSEQCTLDENGALVPPVGWWWP